MLNAIISSDAVRWNMNKIIEAIYKGGVFHPIKPVSLADGERVWITVARRNIAQYDPAVAMERLMAIADKPDSPKNDELGGDQDDRVIYGNQDDLLARAPTPEENQRIIDAIMEIASLPDGQEDDGTGGDKHDEIIYGNEDESGSPL